MPAKLFQFFKFGVIGVINTGTFYALYLLLHSWLPYYPAYVIAFLISMVGSFFLNTYFTYRTKPTWRKFLLFPLSNATNFVISTAGLYLLVHWLGLDSRIAPLVAAAAAIPFTYLVAQFVLVTRTAESELQP